jgi:hypothetical protein
MKPLPKKLRAMGLHPCCATCPASRRSQQRCSWGIEQCRSLVEIPKNATRDNLAVQSMTDCAARREKKGCTVWERCTTKALRSAFEDDHEEE